MKVQKRIQITQRPGAVLAPASGDRRGLSRSIDTSAGTGHDLHNIPASVSRSHQLSDPAGLAQGMYHRNPEPPLSYPEFGLTHRTVLTQVHDGHAIVCRSGSRSAPRHRSTASAPLPPPGRAENQSCAGLQTQRQIERSRFQPFDRQPAPRIMSASSSVVITKSTSADRCGGTFPAEPLLFWRCRA